MNPRNIEDVIQVLKREVIRTQEGNESMDHNEQYKTLLIQTIHKCAIRYAEVADSVVLVLLDFLGGEGGYDVLQCVKSIVEQYPNFRSTIVRKIIDNLDEISTTEALRVGLWVLGEYSYVPDASTNEPMLIDAFDAIKTQLGDMPFPFVKDGDTVAKKETSDTASAPITQTTTKNIVLKDGTYASVTSTEVINANTIGNNQAEEKSHLRKLISAGDVLLGTVACVCLTKLSLKTKSQMNRLTAESCLYIAGVGKLAELKRGNRIGVHADCLERLTECARILLDPIAKEKMLTAFLHSSHLAFNAVVTKQKQIKHKLNELQKKTTISQADDLIQFRQLRSQAVQGGIEVDLMDADDISRAIGAEGTNAESAKLKHVYQLTGYSDPVYAEASVTVHDYDIILEILIINRTASTLTNLTVELATMGDLKLVERPQTHTIGPNDERRVKANIKVSSTETSHIFGTIAFDNASTAQKVYVNLNDIQLDIMDYIRPAECKNEEFRSMWAEFEWENKVAINSNITDLREFVDHIIASTNMTSLTPLDDTIAVSGYIYFYSYCVFYYILLCNVFKNITITHALSLSIFMHHCLYLSLYLCTIVCKYLYIYAPLFVLISYYYNIFVLFFSYREILVQIF